MYDYLKMAENLKIMQWNSQYHLNLEVYGVIF